MGSTLEMWFAVPTIDTEIFVIKLPLQIQQLAELIVLTLHATYTAFQGFGPKLAENVLDRVSDPAISILLSSEGENQGVFADCKAHRTDSSAFYRSDLSRGPVLSGVSMDW